MEKGVENEGKGPILFDEVDDGGRHVPFAEKTDNDLPFRFSGLRRLPGIGDPNPIGKTDRPLAELGPFFGGRIGAVSPEAGLDKIEVKKIIHLLADRLVSHLPCGADDLPGRRLEVVVEQAIPHPRDGEKQHHPDEQDDHGEFDQRVSPLSHFPNC